MVLIARRQIDPKPIIGAVFVFLVIGLIIFGLYYFLFAKPAADALDAAKKYAISQVNSDLATIGTDQASAAVSTYTSQVQAAGSETAINSILANVTATAQLEQKRVEVLSYVDSATNGTYITTSNVTELATLSQNLKPEVNQKTSISDLEAYKTQIDSQATTTWQSHFTTKIGAMVENELIMKHNSPTSWAFMTKTNALTFVSGSSWQDLREVDFENPSLVKVPISETFQSAPTIENRSPNNKVNVYVYNTSTQTMENLVTDATVTNVIYSQSDIAAIAWSLADGATTASYSVNMWETIKAAAAGDAEAAAVAWQSYGSDVMDSAIDADIGSYSISVIYMVQVPEDAGALITQYEQHQSATMDVHVVAVVS